jgi:hypothetical protein
MHCDHAQVVLFQLRIIARQPKAITTRFDPVSAGKPLLTKKACVMQAFCIHRRDV